MTSGFIIGILAALLQALSYLVSRSVLVKGNLHPADLLIRSHIFMGLVSVIALPFTWMTPSNTSKAIFGLLVGAGAYTLAQSFFFWSIRYAPASRLSPMLGLKLLTSAALAVLIRNDDLSFFQVIAVGLTVIAGVAVQYSGEPVSLKPFLGILAAGICFGWSDLGISLLCDGLSPNISNRSPWVSIHAVFITYAFIMVPCFILLLWRQKSFNILPALDRGSATYAAVWLLAMFCLFYTFSTVGIVLGGIIQSTRGPLSIVLALILVRMGWHHLEMNRTRSDFFKQIITATGMVGAMLLYSLG